MFQNWSIYIIFSSFKLLERLGEFSTLKFFDDKIWFAVLFQEWNKRKKMCKSTLKVRTRMLHFIINFCIHFRFVQIAVRTTFLRMLSKSYNIDCSTNKDFCTDGLRMSNKIWFFIRIFLALKKCCRKLTKLPPLDYLRPNNIPTRTSIYIIYPNR